MAPFKLIVIEQGELKGVSLIKAVFVEFLATALFLYWVISVIVNNAFDYGTFVPDAGSPTALQLQVGTTQLSQDRVLTIALQFGFAIFALVYSTASFSGGHINPAVTLGLFVGGRISLVRGVLYILAQLAGAIIGAGIAKGVNANGYASAGGGANELNAGISYAAGWAMETILTGALVFTVFAATDAGRGNTTVHIPVLAPLAIGIVVFLAHTVAIPIDGCSINPARSFGAAVWADNWHSQWLFWIGPFSGAILAALIYTLLTMDDAKTVLPKDLNENVATLPTYDNQGLEPTDGKSSRV